MSGSVAGGRQRRRPARFFVPRSHRLFVVFEDRPAAEAALAGLAQAVPSDDIWFFEGPSGAAELDPYAVTGPARLLSWLFSHNIEHLLELSRIVADGQVVVAVPATHLSEADEVARVLRAGGGQWFSYTAHGNFVPVSS